MSARTAIQKSEVRRYSVQMYIGGVIGLIACCETGSKQQRNPSTNWFFFLFISDFRRRDEPNASSYVTLDY